MSAEATGGDGRIEVLLALFQEAGDERRVHLAVRYTVLVFFYGGVFGIGLTTLDLVRDVGLAGLALLLAVPVLVAFHDTLSAKAVYHLNDLSRRQGHLEYELNARFPDAPQQLRPKAEDRIHAFSRMEGSLARLCYFSGLLFGAAGLHALLATSIPSAAAAFGAAAILLVGLALHLRVLRLWLAAGAHPDGYDRIVLRLAARLGRRAP